MDAVMASIKSELHQIAIHCKLTCLRHKLQPHLTDRIHRHFCTALASSDARSCVSERHAHHRHQSTHACLAGTSQHAAWHLGICGMMVKMMMIMMKMMWRDNDVVVVVVAQCTKGNHAFLKDTPVTATRTPVPAWPAPASLLRDTWEFVAA